MEISPIHDTPGGASGEPFGTSFSDVLGVGFDLRAVGYVEEEYFIDGTASVWATGAVPGEPDHLEGPLPYRTRILVRRPVDRSLTSGVIHLEALHPQQDEGLTWRGAAAHICRSGAVWVGVTVYHHIAELLSGSIDPQRYATLSIPAAGMEWDILGDVAASLAAAQVPEVGAGTLILSGWSATGSFARVFLREGFAERHGDPVDGAVIFISHGGAGDAGYPPLSPGAASIAPDDRRRVFHNSTIPVFEVLSEFESENNEELLRDDADEPVDRYRLYQVAGTGHLEAWPGSEPTNASALTAAGLGSAEITIAERRTDSRLDFVSHAVLELMIGWVVDGHRPPNTPRFDYEGERGTVDRTLARDIDGNAIGGIRTPWIEAPLAHYHPHGSLTPDSPAMPSWSDFDPNLRAWIVATMEYFSPSRIAARFHDESEYIAAFTAATRRLLDEGFLLKSGADALLDSAPARWRAALASDTAHG